MTKEQEIPKKIADKTGIQESRVKEANRAVFEFIKQQMESGERRSVRIRKCGLFSCKPRRVEELDKLGLLNKKTKRDGTN